MLMSSRGFIAYLVSAFSCAVLSALFLTNHFHHGQNSPLLASRLSGTLRVWPDLQPSWRLVLATVIGFVGSACGTVGGVGGGGIFVPMLNLLLGFDTKSAAALSKCMIMGASASSVWFNVRVPHPTKEVPILDYDLALLFQPMLMLGITVGVALSVVFPYWLITVLIIILFIVRIDTKCEPLIPREEKSTVVEEDSGTGSGNDVESCSIWYWVLFGLQFPIALLLFGYEAVKLYKEHKRRMSTGNSECICGASIEWTAVNLAFCALCGIVGGVVGGLLGSGGGFILGPLLLEIGVIPQVASATATFVMMFSSSLSVVEFYLLKRFPIPYALYLTSVSILAGFWGQFFVRRIVAFLGRASIIVFILSGVIFASALTMGVVGIESSIEMINNHEFMGFLGFCSSQ
ncbi:Sulfite exporter TauE/SafE family protein [Vigna angularis]|uniref:Sulfite exporter TauE/SafE family protein n=1 Tax=Phaseolus angularis TaxID=3914 RepID=A0A8T0KTP0_PHAAN|nr:Sulfite exporter TauE/SafE family protein [Vigna angularis]